jgi:VanZ family protein
MKMRKFFCILFFSLLAALLILTYYPHMPQMKVRIHGEWFRLDYLGHFGFYAAITASFLEWRAGWRGKISDNLLIFTVIGSFALAILTEFTQLAVPGRSLSLNDMACNLTGVLIGALVAWIAGSVGRRA